MIYFQLTINIQIMKQTDKIIYKIKKINQEINSNYNIYNRYKYERDGYRFTLDNYGDDLIIEKLD